MFTRRKNHKGCQLSQQWIFGGICRDAGECFMVAVLDKSASTLMPIIMKYISPGTTIIGATAGMDYAHQTVNHSLNFVYDHLYMFLIVIIFILVF